MRGRLGSRSGTGVVGPQCTHDDLSIYTRLICLFGRLKRKIHDTVTLMGLSSFG